MFRGQVQSNLAPGSVTIGASEFQFPHMSVTERQESAGVGDGHSYTTVELSLASCMAVTMTETWSVMY